MIDRKPDYKHVEKTSPDLRRERIIQLKKIFPEVFSEEKVDFEKLRAALEEDILEERPDRYSFTWAGKYEANQLLHVSATGTLIPQVSESVNFDNTQNIFIEGDNLEVLKLLYKPYFNQVKMIYIDPPYNTGNDFVYRDNFADPMMSYLKLTKQISAEGNILTSDVDRNGRYHSNWLSMMYPRLFLARQFLREDGIIFVSIDDHEVYNLRLLMNEIFGEENVLQELVWRRHAGGGNDSKYFAVDHEYILAFAKNKQAIDKLRVPLTKAEKEEFKGRDEYYSTLGPYKTKSFRRMRPDDPRPGLQYTIEAPDGTFILDEWKWEQSRFLDAYKHNKVIIREDKNGKWQVEYKIYYYDQEAEEERTKVPRSLLIDVERNSEGKRQLREMLGQDNVFTNPKPVGLIKYLIQIGAKSDSIIMDFFAGSCTTAQAVFELNAEDGGSRRFIMVQLPEPTPPGSIAAQQGFHTIAEIGKERIRRVICSRSQDRAERSASGESEAHEDLGFRVFKLAKSNYKVWRSNITTDAHKDSVAAYIDQIQLFTDPLIEGWKMEDVMYEVALKEGYHLSSVVSSVGSSPNTIWKVTDPIKEQSFYISLDDEISLELLTILKPGKDTLFVCRDAALTDELASNFALQCRLKTI